jgi:Acyl-CoA dehydrogenase, C-terminal domain
VDTSFTAEQQDLLGTAARLAGRLGPDTVQALGDPARRARLAAAIAAAGLLQLREDDGSGSPAATGVEVGIVAGRLGRALADTPFLGPTLAAEAFRLAGAGSGGAMTIALDRSGSGPAVWRADGTTASLVIDADAGPAALGFIADGDAYALAVADVGDTATPVDLTRRTAVIPEGNAVRPIPGAALRHQDLGRLALLGQVIVCQDLAGVAEGAQALATGYAKTRHQYGAAIGSFQAVRHALAEAATLAEGAASMALFAAWSLDGLGQPEAQRAARAAKAYCAHAARQVCETAVQVHGGIGNTWECLAHLYLRRCLHSGELFGTGPHHLEHLASELLG